MQFSGALVGPAHPDVSGSDRSKCDRGQHCHKMVNEWSLYVCQHRALPTKFAHAIIIYFHIASSLLHLICQLLKQSEFYDTAAARHLWLERCLASHSTTSQCWTFILSLTTMALMSISGRLWHGSVVVPNIFCRAILKIQTEKIQF